MLEAINATIESAMTSPWAYLAMFLAVVVDAFFPLVPGEAVVIAGGVLAASGDKNLVWVIVVAALAAFAGDHVSYVIGRFLGAPVARRVLRGRRGRNAYQRARRAMQTHGGVAIVALRFVAGGRTATTLIAGMLYYPLARFAAFDALAASAWGVYIALLGYWAGGIFAGNPLGGVVTGLAISVVVTVVLEVARLLLRRRRGRQRERA